MLIPPTRPAGLAILALDTGSDCGWALLRSDTTLTYGLHKLPTEAAPARKHVRWASMRHFLVETKNAAGGLDAIYYEHSEFIMTAPNARGVPKAQVLSVMDRGGLYCIVQSFAAHHGIRLAPFNPSTIKKFATGKGNGKKEKVTDAMRAIGFKVDDHNVGDALALLHFAFDREARDAEPATLWRIALKGHENAGEIYEQHGVDTGERTVTLRRPDLADDWRKNDPEWVGDVPLVEYPLDWLEKAGGGA